MIKRNHYRFRKIAATFLLYLQGMSITLPSFAYENSSDLRAVVYYGKSDNNRSSEISPVNTATLPANEKEKREVFESSKRARFTSGPSQPEMTSFQSVSMDNMVNLFTGDFSYNIPLMDVGGYPVNLFYNAGVTMDQEASWVGLGWNINAGTINREIRGVPDDFNGGSDVITKKQSIKPNKEIGLTYGAGVEAAGKPLSISASFAFNYSNYRGVGVEHTFGASYAFERAHASSSTEKTAHLKKSLSLSLNTSSRGSVSVNPSFSLEVGKEENSLLKGTLQGGLGFSSRSGIESFQMNYYGARKTRLSKSLSYRFNPGFALSFARPAYTPSIKMPFTNVTAEFSYKFGNELPLGVTLSNDISGFYKSSFIAAKDRVRIMKAFGYLNYQNAANDNQALLDFNRMSDGSYIDGVTPVISIPQYTFDVFSISGEGTGGSFRAYRSDIGYVKDSYVKNRSINASAGIDLGTGADVKTGVNLSFLTSPSSVGEWNSSNMAADVIKFRSANGAYEPVYFRNPSEKATAPQSYYNKIGGDKLIRVQLLGAEAKGPVTEATANFLSYEEKESPDDRFLSTDAASLSMEDAVNSRLTERDKRTQVISYLNAEEASKVGLDKEIKSYLPFNSSNPASCNSEFKNIPRYSGRISGESYRLPNHISEIDILQEDGRRYVYGIPVYNISRTDVTIATNASDRIGETDMATYSTPSAAIDSKDKLYNEENISPYAHSFLLSGILSPDYSDVTGNGITDDDIGTAVKFNYSRVGLNGDKWNNFQWRTPASNSAPKSGMYNEGLRTDKSDDKVSYSYGEKELWYMHSIESKTMVAYFIIDYYPDVSVPSTQNKVISRKDAFGFNAEGVLQSSGIRLHKLERIELYAKADLIKNKGNAKPVKTVHFEYDYSLCKNVPENNSQAASGRLTLKKVYFTYNVSHQKLNSLSSVSILKGYKNRYEFRYNSGTGDEFNYNSLNHDRWGNFKTKSDNPGLLSNSDYPYALQAGDKDGPNYEANKEKIDRYAGALNLKEIDLPSGGTIKVTYEADDYAYVQNKPAAEMMQVLGFGFTPQSFLPKTYSSSVGFNSFNYAFFKVPVAIDKTADPVKNASQVYERYLKGQRQLLMKLYVRVPNDNYVPSNTAPYEYINVYATFESYGLYDQPGNKSDIIWVKMKTIDIGGGLDHVSPVVATVFQFLKDNLPSKVYPSSDTREDLPILNFIKASFSSLSAFKYLAGENKIFSNSLFGNIIDPVRSFVRLNSPQGQKIGGGHRVKKIVLMDNWNRLTGDEPASEYGKQYSYTTQRKRLDNSDEEISSGVAAYEPGFGAEENPFKETLNYTNQNFMGPAQIGAIELPLAEAYFPSPVVGYSKVCVHSINVLKNGSKVKGNPGVEETEYFTTKDFPTRFDYSLLDAKSRSTFNPELINKFLKFYSVRRVTVSQGFRVQLNDMNGKLKSQSVYPEFSPQTPISYTRYHYKCQQYSDESFVLKNEAKIVKDASGEIVNGSTIGKDIEVMVDFRQHRNTTKSVQLNFNLDAKYPILILPTFFTPFSYAEDMYRSASTLKVVTAFGILDHVETFNKGSLVSAENLVYDGETGEVVVSSSNNLYDKKIFSVNYPAWWAYEGMGPAYRNIGVSYKGVVIRNGFIESTHVDQSLLKSGDELYVKNRSTFPYFMRPSDFVQKMPSNALCTSGCDELIQSTESKVWVVALNKDPNNASTNEIILVDKNGIPYNGQNVDFKVVRSGCRNLLSAQVGAATTMIDPLEINPGYLTVTNSNKVLNASAATFKESWKTDDAFFTGKQTNTILHEYPVHTIDVPIVDLVNGTYYNTKGSTLFSRSNVGFLFESGLQKNYFGARHKVFGDLKIGQNGNWNQDAGTHTFRISRSWLKLDMSTIPLNSKVIDARFHLSADNEQRFQAFPNRNHTGTATTDALYGYSGGTYLPHRNPNFQSNSIVFEAMNSTWNPNTSTGDNWQKRFLYDNLILPSSKSGSLSTPSILSAKSFTGADAINVTPTIKSIQQLRSIGGEPGMRIRIAEPRNPSEYAKQQYYRINQQTTESPHSKICEDHNYQLYCGEPGGCSISIKTYDCDDEIFHDQTGLLTSGYHQIIFSTKLGGLIEFTFGGSVISQTLTLREVYFNGNTVTQNLSFIKVKYYNPAEECTGGCQGETYKEEETTTTWGCVSVHTRDYVNPYVHGILGNWRNLKSYAFYGDREQSMQNNLPNPSSDGAITGFTPFWNLVGARLIQTTNEFNWKWTNGVTQYNSRGLELESKDPLNRYSAALYGYNQSMPIAMASNARYNEIGFDSFEDYNFSDEFCTTLCKPVRHINIADLVSGNGQISSNEKHSGNLSLKIGVGETLKFEAPVKQPVQIDPVADIPIVRPSLNISPLGKGLTAKYKAKTGADIIKNDQYPFVHIGQKKNCGSELICPYKTDESVTNLPPGAENQFAFVTWEGWLQVEKTGVYLFNALKADDGATLFIKNYNTGAVVINGIFRNTDNNIPLQGSLSAGIAYQITITYFNNKKAGDFLLTWKGSCDNSFVTIPSKYLYNASNRPSISQLPPLPCLPARLKMKNPLNERFQLIPGNEYILSAWVKETGANCGLTNFTNNEIDLKFKSSGQVIASVVLHTQGNLIDGWQRYESKFLVPVNAEEIEVEFKNSASSGVNVYFDDFRIHPFLSNMKSFVYEPNTLRLSSELDENNYASYYDYDEEGTLIRVRKETQDGVKTIQETRSSISKRN